MSLLDLPKKYLFDSAPARERSQLRRNTEKYHKIDKYYEKSSHHDYKSTYTPKEKYSRSNMVELRSHHKIIKNREIESGYRSTSKHHHKIGHSREDRKPNKNDARKVIKKPHSEELKWEEELYGSKNKKIKYELLIKGKSADKSIALSSSCSKLAVVNHNSKVVAEPFNCSKENEGSVWSTAFSENVCFHEENHLENLPIINPSNIASENNSNCKSTAFVIIDYGHEDKCLDMDLIKNIVNCETACDSTIVNKANEQLIRLTVNSFEEKNVGNDLVALANLVVNAPCNDLKTVLPKQGSERPWKLYKLDVVRTKFSKNNIDLSRCRWNDPRVEHLWNTK